MITGKKYTSFHPFFFMKKHYCPQCKVKMQVVKLSKIINSNSPEAKNYDFSNGDTFLTGDVEFITKALKCPECNRVMTYKDMK